MVSLLLTNPPGSIFFSTANVKVRHIFTKLVAYFFEKRFNTWAMAITYNENDNSIEIKDTLKTQYWITNMSLIFMIINCILFPAFILEKQQMEWFGSIWILIGIASVIALIYQLLKVSASENLKLTEIYSLKERHFLGQKSISLHLKNGKFRDLRPMQNESELIRTKNFFKNIGIQIT